MLSDEENIEDLAKKPKVQIHLRIFFKNILVSIISSIKEELEFLSSLKKGDTIHLDTIAEDFRDDNFNRAGFKLCFSIYNGEFQENWKGKSGEIVSALAVAHHLKLKSVVMTCGSLMKINVDKKNCLMFYNACKQYSQTLTRNELFHWLLINFFNLIAGENIPQSQLDQVDRELLLNLLKNDSLVVPSELKLYIFIKIWINRNMEKNQRNVESFDSLVISEEYEDILSSVRLSSLLAYTKDISTIIDDEIIPEELIHQTLFDMHKRILQHYEPVIEEPKNQFRIAQRFEKNVDQTFETEFFCRGVVLKFKFTSKQLSVTPARSASKLFYQGSLSARMRFTLYGSLVRDQCRFTTETSEPITIELVYGKEKTIANWRKIVTFPCTLSGEIVIGESIIEAW